MNDLPYIFIYKWNYKTLVNKCNGSDDKPSVICISRWRDRSIHGFSELRQLDGILAGYYERIEQKYGFKVAGFRIEDTIP